MKRTFYAIAVTVLLMAMPDVVQSQSLRGLLNSVGNAVTRQANRQRHNNNQQTTNQQQNSAAQQQRMDVVRREGAIKQSAQSIHCSRLTTQRLV